MSPVVSLISTGSGGRTPRAGLWDTLLAQSPDPRRAGGGAAAAPRVRGPPPARCGQAKCTSRCACTSPARAAILCARQDRATHGAKTSELPARRTVRRPSMVGRHRGGATAPQGPDGPCAWTERGRGPRCESHGGGDRPGLGSIARAWAIHGRQGPRTTQALLPGPWPAQEARDRGLLGGVWLSRDTSVGSSPDAGRRSARRRGQCA